MRVVFSLALTLALTPAVRANSSSLLAVSADGKRLLVANTDAGTVSVVDLATRTKACELPAGDHPEGVAWAGTVALATVYGDDRVVFYDPDAKTVLGVLPVADEPYGVVATRDGRRAYVAHDYPGTVTEIDVPNRKVLRTFAVGANCRGIALSADESTLYVCEFLSAKLHAVDIASGKRPDTWGGGYETDNLCRHVEVHPTRPKAYLSHLRSRVTAFDARASIFPQISMADLWTRPAGEKRWRSVALDTYNGVYVPANPWESAASPDGKTLYTVYAGTNDANVHTIIDDDYREIEPRGRVVRIGSHPRAVKVSPDSKDVYIYNTIDYEVGIYDPALKKRAAVKVCEPPQSADWRRGKELFVTARPPMGRTGWVSCSSCHPDGLTDGRVWQNPEGHRRTQSLFGLAHTHPLHWSADRDEVQDFEYTVRGRLMQGRGLCDAALVPRKSFTHFAELEMTTSGLSSDLDALAVYTNSFPFRLSPHAVGPGKLTPEAERGRAIFRSAKAQCATCHAGPYFTDSTLTRPYKVHDVGTGGHEAEKVGPRYDTPTLLGVYRAGPYLHDGRAKTLEDVVTSCNVGDKHGTTSHLSTAEVGDLVAFLKSLPYETPPDDTPNAVTHRVKLTYPRPKE